MTYEQLLAEMAEVLPGQWLPVFRQVPRSWFIPPVALLDTGPELVPIDNRHDPDGWLDAVNSDQVVITQMDDGVVPAGQQGKVATSSCSMPSMVARMLGALDPQRDQGVLELGTGTGWNAALLAHRLGDDRVTTVEIDPVVAEQARKALAAAGFHPRVVVGDGEQGYSPDAPYDRVLSTCSVNRVPYSWVAQTRAGGRIVTPWRDPFCRAGKLLRLHVDGGVASGRFVDWASFMMSRLQRYPTAEVPALDGEVRTSNLHPDLVLDGDHAETALGARLGACQWWREDATGAVEVHLDDLDSGSWVIVGPLADDSPPPYPVRQGGPRRLWDEVEQAYTWWHSVGRPGYDRFGITVTPDRQWVWLDEPGQRISAPIR